jgi:hypothetical protein
MLHRLNFKFTPPYTSNYSTPTTHHQTDMLPVKTNDPQSVEFSELAIDCAREAIRDARLSEFKDKEAVSFALASIAHAHCFHEENLRRVNRTAEKEGFANLRGRP